LDFNRCILCGLCVQASRDCDGKNIFAIGGYGIGAHLIVNSQSGKLGDTDMALTDRAAHVCPVGVIVQKRIGFSVPIGQRTYDARPLADTVKEDAT
jgi:[NiFe] hydrogenase diaphorase moiety small subunit